MYNIAPIDLEGARLIPVGSSVWSGACSTLKREFDGSRIDPSGAGKTVLVVDDNAVIRKLLAAAFLSDGFKTCVEAENGKEGIDAAKRAKPDLVVLDLAMPVMTGLQAAPELRKLLPKTSTVLFTLYGQSLSQVLVSEAGINVVLEKTVPLSTLIDKRTR